MADRVIGLVSYNDDPTNFFRKVVLQDGDDDALLDDPQWIDPAYLGVDENGITRPASLVKVQPNDPLYDAPLTGSV